MKKTYSIQHITTQSTLFEGIFASLKTCTEAAVREGADLSGADFRLKNLHGANLDDGAFAGADFRGTNLGGANLSEANLRGCRFENANLVDTCLAHSNAQGSDFSGARLGATDIAGADLRECLFAGLATFSLDFMAVADMGGSAYRHIETRLLPMTRPPRVLMGFMSTVAAMLDQHMVIGQRILPLAQHSEGGTLLKEILYRSAQLY